MNGYKQLAFGILTSICLVGCGGDPGDSTENANVATQEQADLASAIDPGVALPRSPTYDAGVADYALRNPLWEPCIQCPGQPSLQQKPMPGY